MKKIFFIIALIPIFVLNLNAKNISNTSSDRPEIIKHIEKNSKIKIKQDPSLDKLMDKYKNRVINPVYSGPYVGAGYRLQVFSSNAQRTAKNESYQIELKLRSAFPNQGVYRIYSSPFWKVRIGDFRSTEDAQTFRTELLKVFPELRKETYTVRESKVRIR